MSFPDHFSRDPQSYCRYRPRYPEPLFDYLASVAPARALAVDCATGNGQAAAGLVSRFDRVLGLDASPNQVVQATAAGAARGSRAALPARFAVALAEALPLRAECVDLLTVAQAAHWLEFDRFYAEVRRVVRPGGVVALWSYPLFEVDEAIDREVRRFVDGIVGGHWPPQRSHIDADYQTIPFPFPELETPRVEMTADWGLDRLVGYMGTWSAVLRYRRATGDDPLPALRSALARRWGEGRERRVRWALALRVGRVG
ncbi:MAG: class I SAM-dependent methyltransferase [Thermoanaerobaculia bacterium]|nr:class I SAM-dependent methyltransferase [Thermoanaerobaculia bacterium]